MKTALCSFLRFPWLLLAICVCTQIFEWACEISRNSVGMLIQIAPRCCCEGIFADEIHIYISGLCVKPIIVGGPHPICWRLKEKRLRTPQGRRNRPPDGLWIQAATSTLLWVCSLPGLPVPTVLWASSHVHTYIHTHIYLLLVLFPWRFLTNTQIMSVAVYAILE